MEIMRFGKDRLKVTMDKTDMENYMLDCGETGCDPKTRTALRMILDEAQRTCGFDAASERMLVRLFPSRGGGCEIFVTLLGGALERERHKNVLVFSDISCLLRACAAVSSLGFCGESEAYCGENGESYLTLDDVFAAEVGLEYGESVSAEKFECIRGEYVRLISSPDAVHTLALYDVR